MTGRHGTVLAAGGIGALALSLIMVNTRAVSAAPASTPVTVTNTDAQPVPIRDLREEGKQAFQITGGAVVQTNGCAGSPFTIPANKRLVVEHVTLSAVLPPDRERLFALSITNGSGSEYVEHTIAARREPGRSFYTASESLLAFGAPGTQACVAVHNGDGITDGYAVSYMLSGYLINL